VAFVNLTGYLGMPGIDSYTGATAHTSILLDAADEKAAFIFLAPKTGSIRKLGFRTNTVTTGATVDVRLETVNASTGEPTGTLAGTNTNVALVIGNGDDNTWFTVTLTADAAVTFGDPLALVIVNPSGTPGTLNIANGYGANQSMALPYVALFTASWTKTASSMIPFYVEYSDGSTLNAGGAPISAQSAVTFNSGSVVDERSLYFQIPFPAKLGAVELLITGWTGDAEVILYDSDGTTPLGTISVDQSVTRGATATFMRLRFSAAITLAASTNYRLALKPTSTSDVIWYETVYDSTAIMNSVDGGANFHLSTRVDAGSWGQTTTRRPCVSLLFSAVDDGTGSGGVYGRCVQGASF
jgi:hypothetical protein